MGRIGRHGQHARGVSITALRTIGWGWNSFPLGVGALFTPDAVLDGAQGRHAGRQALRASVGQVWAAEGPATLHLTLNPVIDPGPSHDQAALRSVLLIIDPAPPAIRATAVITQELRRAEGSWRITRRSVAPPPDSADRTGL